MPITGIIGGVLVILIAAVVMKVPQKLWRFLKLCLAALYAVVGKDGDALGNGKIESLQEQFRKQREVISDIAHEVATNNGGSLKDLVLKQHEEVIAMFAANKEEMTTRGHDAVRAIGPLYQHLGIEPPADLVAKYGIAD